MKFNTKCLFILSILPLLFFISGSYFDRAHYAGDPNYIYLMNGVNICMGHQVGNADNPGTPVMILSAVVLKGYQLIVGMDETIQISVLKNPDHYIAIIRIFLDILNSFALFFVGLVVFLKTRSFWSAFIMQLTPFLSVNLLEHVWSKVSPEPFLLFIVLIFSLIVILFYYDKNRNQFMYPLLFGLLTGLGIATKATFLPLIFFPFIIIPRWGKKLVFVVLSIVSFVTFTLPALQLYNSMFTWFKALFMHSGIYGKGETGIIDTSVYLKNLYLIIYNNPLLGVFLFVMISLLATSLFSKRFKLLLRDNGTANLLLALFISQIAGLLIVAKHYHANHYLLPVLSLAGLDVLIFLSIFKKLLLKPNKAIWTKRSIGIILVSFILIFNVPLLLIKDNGYANTNQQFKESKRILMEDYPQYFCMYNYPWSHNRYTAFKFGNNYAGLLHTSVLETLYPNTYFYDSRVKGFNEWYLPAGIETILFNQGNKIILSGFPMSAEDLTLLDEAGYPFKQVMHQHTQALYILDTTSFSFQNHNRQVVEPPELFCDMETVSSDGVNFIAKGNFIGSAHLKSDEISRSGIYAIKLNEDVEFAFDFKIENFYPGSSIYAHIWRYPSGSKTNIVFSAENSDEFYICNSEAVTIDENGWEKIELYFQNPLNEKKIDKLIFYLWNSEQETVYFDDLHLIHK